MVETDVLSLALAWICRDSRDLESLSTSLLAGCAPSLSQKQTGRGEAGRGQGGTGEGQGGAGRGREGLQGCVSGAPGCPEKGTRGDARPALPCPPARPCPLPVTTWGPAVLPPLSSVSPTPCAAPAAPLLPEILTAHFPLRQGSRPPSFASPALWPPGLASIFSSCPLDPTVIAGEGAPALAERLSPASCWSPLPL